MIIDLAYWHCGKTAQIEVSREPTFAFEIAGWANDICWYGYQDPRLGRVLVFCCVEHARAEMTKTGVFRARPKGIKKNTSPTGGEKNP